MNTRGKSVEDPLAAYRKGTADMGERDPKRVNKGFFEAHACYKALKDKEEGRKGIIALMDDENPYVRCSAAAHCLQWVPHLARQVLENLRDNDREGAFTAKMVLEEFDGGRLSFDF